MTQTTTLQERRILNEAIESSYIESAALSAGIRTHAQTGRGSILELYEQFHTNFGILFDITSDLEELKSDGKTIAETNEWLELPPPKQAEMEDRARCGREMFKRYKKTLNACGLIALPSRGK